MSISPQADTAHDAADDAAHDGPQPEPIRFYGTSWVDHSRGYALRRVGLGAAALLLAVAGVLAVWVALVGPATAWLRGLLVVALALCAAMAFTWTWRDFARPAADGRADESAFRSIKAVGFVGVLLAYALRTAVEAPGERLRRLDHEAAVARHRRTLSKRSRNPARRGGRRRP